MAKIKRWGTGSVQEQRQDEACLDVGPYLWSFMFHSGYKS